MTSQTLKQKHRQKFGYYMENVLARHFIESGVFVISYSYCKAKHNIQYSKISLRELRKKLEKTNWFLEIWRENYSIAEDIEGEIESLVRSNHIEMIRWENGEPIISEIKSKFGPDTDDSKIYFTKAQIKRLLDFLDVGINVSVFVAVALDTPRFIEIPFKEFKLPDYENKRNDKITMRIPTPYRDISKYSNVLEDVYSYSDFDSLIEELKRFHL